MNAPMTAMELAKMLEGWPEEARPTNMYRSGNYETSPLFAFYATDGYIGDHAIPLGHAIDLACMSGLRHMGGGAYGQWLDQPPEKRWWFRRPGFDRHFTGPTLLHAIDAAIRGSK